MEPPILEESFKVPSFLQAPKPEVIEVVEKPANTPTVQENPYREPKWSTQPPDPNLAYYFEVMKSGVIIQKFEALQRKVRFLYEDLWMICFKLFF